MMEDIYQSSNCSGLAGLVALHLSKAFDTVNHNVLMGKLAYYGIDFVWFKSYLTNLIQSATINGQSSEYIYVDKGVPQGSILGHWLILVFPNDLPVSQDHYRVNMYASLLHCILQIILLKTFMILPIFFKLIYIMLVMSTKSVFILVKHHVCYCVPDKNVNI